MASPSKEENVLKLILENSPLKQWHFEQIVREAKVTKTVANKWLKKYVSEDLIKYGFIAEFMGRLPVLVYLESLSPSALRDILWKPKNSQVKQYQKLLELDQVDLTFTDDALDAIVEEALKRKSGARGLRSVIERVMLNVMYDLPDLPEIRHCEIDAAVVRGERKAIIDSRENAS